MKKIYILAAVALVASAACTKIETPETPETGSKIAFEVANYMSTKAAGDPKTSLKAEGFESFNTYANFFPETGNVQTYMNNVAVNFTAGTPNVWAPARDYYWPKTGWINFYSYAGSQAPAITFNGDKTVATAAYTDKTIAADDNFLLADAALKQNQNLTEYTSISGVTSGVPTLFRHQLAKLNFDIKLATTDAKKSTTTKFVVKVLNAGSTVSTLKADSKGSLTLTNTVDANANPHTLAWNDNGVKVWTPSATPVVETMDFLTPELTLDVNTTESSKKDLLKERTVMPQTLDDDNDFTLTYQVETYYGSEATPYMTEIITVTGKLRTLVNSITAWNKNTKITYHIVIDPVGNKVTFDPAVEDWDTTVGTYNYPTA